MKRHVTMTLASVFILTACGEDVKTVEWWKAHDEQRAEFVKKCRNDNAKMKTANCQNATKADFHKKLIGDPDEAHSPEITSFGEDD
ncbi:EexN family lipoprotein [Halomonas sabkhae]|uniref:EexN family lipoprotein n=1 Tax=Halomonas sabkhae TaxID=626223 RepID=UPI0025B2D415|nr:EexN family lipoprotein [Halomonas sabkhae]MDN3525309.1 EexN family lipoprotein [Halomonas sabkhae]